MIKKHNKLLTALAISLTTHNIAIAETSLDYSTQTNEQAALTFNVLENIQGTNSNTTNTTIPFELETEGSITIGSVSNDQQNEEQKNTNITNDIENPTIITELSGTSAALMAIINSQSNHIQWQGINNRLRSPQEVRALYTQFNFQPLWLDNGKITELAEQVIIATQKATHHALRPETYHSAATSTLKAGQKVAEPEKFDIIMSDAFITYKSHLTNGIVPPKQQFSDWNKKKEDLDFVSLYLNSKSTNNINKIFTVDDADYKVIQKAYIEALNNQDTEKFTEIPAKSLKPKQSGLAVSILRGRLGLDDSIDVYDEELKQAVKAFQKNNGLGADGVAGKNTLSLLNRSPKNRLQTLAINMERYRWNYTPEGNYVWVNIPAYKMAVRNGNKKLFQSNVIVGRPKRPTPIFSDTLENVVLAPYWNVPSTIFKEDKLPKLRKNPNAFSNMQVISTSTGKIVSASSVNWANGGTGYRLRQKPGPRNALGRMKFLFPNKHAIYLHDTPGKKLFKKSRRAFSSGCIRVERADDLALFLLNDIGYDKKRIKKESRRSKEKWIKLGENRRYPVFLDYYTAWVDDNGEVRYSNDIYGYDKKLKKLYTNALNAL